MTTCSSVLAWKLPWIEESGGLQSMGVTELDTTEQLILPLSRIFGEPNELIQRPANFFYKGPDSKYFRHCGPCSRAATSLLCYHGVKTAMDDMWANGSAYNHFTRKSSMRAQHSYSKQRLTVFIIFFPDCPSLSMDTTHPFLTTWIADMLFHIHTH